LSAKSRAATINPSGMQTDSGARVREGAHIGKTAAPMAAATAARVAWGFGGFLIGAVFWHAIGFWGFLSDVILRTPEPQPGIVAQMAPPLVLPNCTTLVLNRATGETTSVPCADQPPLLEEARVGRQDLALAGPATW